MKKDQNGYIYFKTRREAIKYVNGGYTLKEDDKYYPLTGINGCDTFSKIEY